jgi:hypothetical protein
MLTGKSGEAVAVTRLSSFSIHHFTARSPLVTVFDGRLAHDFDIIELAGVAIGAVGLALFLALGLSYLLFALRLLSLALQHGWAGFCQSGPPGWGSAVTSAVRPVFDVTAARIARCGQGAAFDPKKKGTGDDLSLSTLVTDEIRPS